MLSIGEFSNICKVSAKTLRYYAQIGLLAPEEVNPETGYRYYSIEQLETMLLINRLKGYGFSLDEMKKLLDTGEANGQLLMELLSQKKVRMEQQITEYQKTIGQMEEDLRALQRGESVMAYIHEMDVQLVDVPQMCLLSVRKLVCQADFPSAYQTCFPRLFEKIKKDKLTVTAPPMVLFHSTEFTPEGMDTEFAIPVKEIVTGTRDFCPGLCIKTVLKGSYENLPSVYARQREWVEREGYMIGGAVYESYVTDPSSVHAENELVTEIYCPVKKRI